MAIFTAVLVQIQSRAPLTNNAKNGVIFILPINQPLRRGAKMGKE